MTITTRPDSATHVDALGNYYKAGDELNWLLFVDGMGGFACGWTNIGTLPAGTLSLLAPMAPQVPSACPKPEFPYSPEQVADGALVRELERDTPFTNYFAQYRFVGSRITCNPPPLDTDQDVLVHVHATNMATVQNKLQAAGFVREGSNPADMNANVDKQSVFFSFRNGDMNYIITSELEFYERFSTATELARKWNLLEKSDRIQLFQAVLYGKWWA